ncbi:MAG: replication-associated recombination protein A [Flavobacteriales bacterium]
MNAPAIPLAERMRPLTLDDYMGQDHLVGEGSVLRRAIEAGNIPSMIFWGPPGVGKTTLATIISHQLNRPFYTLSAINSGVKDIREVISKVQNQGLFGGNNAILFIDEIHRFSKSQQDSLLGAVEKGTITLIGATTENPSFEVISALLSRSQVYVMKSFDRDAMRSLVNRALEKDELLRARTIDIQEEEALFRLSGGDARKLLNSLELVVNMNPQEPLVITNELVTDAIQENLALYDKGGEQHYDVISAFIKSIRGSDPNAAVYYLARMVEGGEDPKFIARRLVILASEDIGLANPNALLLATASFEAIERIGWPEGRIVLSQCAIYLASSPKSNAAYKAIGEAQSKVRETGALSVPLHIRNAPTKLMKDLGYGSNYEYSHDYDRGFSPQEYLPEEIKGTRFYTPGSNPAEGKLQAYLKSLWGGKYKY